MVHLKRAFESTRDRQLLNPLEFSNSDPINPTKCLQALKRDVYGTVRLHIATGVQATAVDAERVCKSQASLSASPQCLIISPSLIIAMLPPFAWVVIAIIAYLAYARHKRVRALPPGPFAWPLIGNYVQVGLACWRGQTIVDWYEECKKTYGNVFTFWQGPMPVVMVLDYETTIDAYQRIIEEITYKFDRLDEVIDASPEGKVLMDPGPFLDMLIVSVINRILVGYRYDEKNEEELRKLKGGLDKQLDEITPVDMVVFSKFTYWLPILKQRYEKVVIPQVEILDHLSSIVQARKAMVRSGAHLIDQADPDDYIDAYIAEMERREKSGEPIGSFSDKFLYMNLLDLFLAGTETSIGTIKWGLLHMLHKPEIQDKLREEVLHITRGNRFVEITDKTSMPYTNAVVAENLRCNYVLNFNVLHEITEDTVIGGYFIPKGTATTPQLCVAFRDPKLFENPLEFNPDRYLNDKLLDKKVIAFGVGKRACIGESLARAELFLFWTNFVQRYKFSPVEGDEPPPLVPVSPLTNMHRSKPFKIVVQKVKH
uniref:Unspecific monooxygenase n=1 Tax=Steinernema glaseri TaxID=37863 RepID=A0A1I7Z830_9BILA